MKKTDWKHISNEITRALEQYARRSVKNKRADVVDLQRQLALANSIIETKNKALNDMLAVPHGAGAGAHSGNGGVPNHGEPGLSTQGKDSIGG
ncbi:Uncharacterised protein [uncultured archaeon]|nr:Uncharacterised protein [uncultured archaeon]